MVLEQEFSSQLAEKDARIARLQQKLASAQLPPVAGGTGTR